MRGGMRDTLDARPLAVTLHGWWGGVRTWGQMVALARARVYLGAGCMDESSLSSELPLNSLESDEDGTNADILCFSVSSLFLEAY